jgi:hypothetical protein
MESIQSLIPFWMVKIAKLAAAPIVSAKINAPIHICKTPKAKIKTLLQIETYFLTSKVGKYGRSGAI